MSSSSFTICDSTTKRIIRTGSCRTIDLSLQAQPGEVLVEGIQGNAETQVLNANGTALESGQGYTLEQRKARAQQRLDARYLLALTQGAPVGRQVMPSDALTRARIARAYALSLSNPSQTFRVRSQDSGVWFTLGAAQIATAMASLDALDAAADARHAELSAQIATTNSSVVVVVLLNAIDQFWP